MRRNNVIGVVASLVAHIMAQGRDYEGNKLWCGQSAGKWNREGERIPLLVNDLLQTGGAANARKTRPIWWSR